MASPEGVSVQTVKLKILYTFDADFKDIHLTRWPHPVEVNTCFVDNASQIGAVDLRTCLEAVINASPEMNRVDQDYAVYAFDYSEEDTPLVGQGMLSKALSMQDEGTEQDSEQLVTGKVLLGAMGLLSKNSQSTLEVKLRFKPVSVTPAQRMRSGSISSQDGRPAWLQNDNNQQRPTSPMDTTGLQTMQRMLSEGGPPRERTNSMFPDSHTNSRPGSRAGTPSFHNFDFPPHQAPNAYPRPDSRTGMRQPSHARRDSFNSGYYSGEENMDEGPARKRAKPSKVDWPSKSNFNIEQQPNSLRVAASTAQSVRIHRPIAMAPAHLSQTGHLVEEPVRPPTPIPTKTGRGKGRVGRLKKIAPSNLAPTLGGRNSSQNPSSSLHLPPPSDAMDTVVSSPEETRPHSASTTPANIPSSPPVMFEPSGPLITSPALPPMPMNMMNHDSGFMSGNLDDMFDDGTMLPFDDFLMDKPHDQQANLNFDQNDSRLNDQDYPPVFEEGNDFDPTQQPHASIETDQQDQQQQQKIPLPPPPRPMSRSQSFNPVNRPGLSSPKLAPAPIPRARQIMDEQRAKGLLPQLPASEPGTRNLQRSQTWAPDSDALMSEAFYGDDPTRPRQKKKVGKEQTKARLENAIAAGEMPPYCDNCGSIETPAWRRAYAKNFTCPWDEIETSLSHGAINFKQVLSHNPDGTVHEFKGLKTDKVAEDEDEGWRQISLCNPCGLWFHKQKCPRPKEKWQKKQNGGINRRKRAPKKGQKKSINSKSDAPTPMSDDSSPADTATEAPEYYDNDHDYDETNTGEDDNTDSNEPQLPPMPQNMRANSAEPLPRGLARARPNHLAATRQVQSSPGQPRGSEGDPIHVDLTPKPTRRQLFPSPNGHQVQSDPTSNGMVMKATTNLPSFVRRSPRLNKTKDIFQVPGIAGAVALTADGKENITPDVELQQSLDELFDVEVETNPLPPSTPTPTRRSERLIMKTPRQFGDELSGNAQRSPTFRTPKTKSGFHPAIDALLGTAGARKNVADMTPISRSIAETLSAAYEEGLVTPPGGERRRNVAFDFPDLPSLNNASPMNMDPLLNVNFSELPTELPTEMNDPFSTDAPMPSSPPGFFAFINPDGHLEDGILWDGMGEMGQPQESQYPDPETMSMAPPPSQVLRRSPRKSKGR